MTPDGVQKQIGRVKVTFKTGKADFESPSQPLLSLLSSSNSSDVVRQRLCDRSRASLRNCYHDVWGVPPALHDVLRAAVAEHEHLQAESLNDALHAAHDALHPHCTTP
jgi:hypothetical protein